MLTDRQLRGLLPRPNRYTTADARGLYIEVMPSGVMTWRYRYKLAGKAEKLTIGTYPAMSLAAARTRRDQAEALVTAGTSPAKQKQKAKARIDDATTVAEFAERFFRDIQAKDRKDPTMPRRYLDKDILPFIGARAMSSLTAEDVRAIVWRKKDHGFDAAAGQIRGLLRRMCDYAVTCGVLTANPALAIPMRHVHKANARDRTLSPAEVGQFIVATRESNMRRQFALALHLLLLTLARKSELLLARWDDVHIESAEWHVPVENSKTGKPHVVYLSRQSVAIFERLRSLASGSALVLPGRGSLTRPFAHNALNRALHEAMAGTDIPAFTVHDLRRTASTLLHENGWPSDVVEKALNHTIGGVRGVYNRAEYADKRREMLQFWADYVDAQIGGKVVLGRFGVAG